MSKNAYMLQTNQPSQLVNQKEILQTVKDAIYRNDDSCQIVVLRGDGGLGKTRLLEEILRRLNHPETVAELGPAPKGEIWAEEYPDKALPGDLLDFMDVKLHARYHFMEMISDPQKWFRKSVFQKFERQKGTKTPGTSGGISVFSGICGRGNGIGALG
ncbi:MAG: hypothetical protein M5U34_27880 [Chloroflexi bacterium]|nr:hypothetical protein [Chloroflexota bacterium]